MLSQIIRKARSILRNKRISPRFPGERSKKYWTQHNVTLHKKFTTKAESLEYFHWRNDQYFQYIDLMPVAGFDGKSVLDFGCGPGHDLIGFGTYSNCARLVGADVSTSSINETKSRLQLHGINAEAKALDSRSIRLPFEDAEFDHIHTSGVLHHTADPIAILSELRRVLKPDGTMNIMVYNYDSIWVHLYVAYERTIVNKLYGDESLHEQFRHSTDGEDCPISNCYRPAEWISICRQAGLNARFAGASVSVYELSLLEKRFAAIMNPKLPRESRDFLTSLTFDQNAIPRSNGHVAGIDACFHVTRN